MKLNRDDINFIGNSVIVHGKGDKEREVYFNVRCAIWLNDIWMSGTMMSLASLLQSVNPKDV